MQKILEIILSNPKKMLIILFVITLVSIIGMTKLEFDNTEETGMPKSDPTYRLGEETRKLFKDTETFILASIEPTKNEKILSKKVFSHINNLVNEISEYMKFNQEIEDKRLNTLIKQGNIQIIESSIKKSEADKEGEEKYVQPIRERYIYDYNKYTPINLLEIINKLDEVGKAQLNTILNSNSLSLTSKFSLFMDDKLEFFDIFEQQKLSSLNKNELLSRNQFSMILESLEDIYLYKSLEIVEVFVNPITLSDILGEDDTLASCNLIKKDEDGNRIIPSTPKEFKEYKTNLFRNPSFKNNFYSIDENGTIRALAFSLMLRRQKNYEQFIDYYWELVEKYNTKPVKILMQGGFIFGKFINDYNKRDLQKYVPMVLIIIIITFFLNFRSARGVLLPALTVIMGTVWTMGLMGFLGIKMTIVSTILPPLLIAIGSSYSIHIFNQYMIDLETIHEMGRGPGLRKAMLHISNTVFLTGLTTFISFATLMINDIIALSDFGLFAALGTAFSVMVSVTLIVATLMITKTLSLKKDKLGEKKREANVFVKNIVNIFSTLSINHYKMVIIFAVLSICISAIGITLMTTETSATSYFNPGTYIRESLDRTNELFKGTYIINIVLSPGKDKSILDSDFLNYIEEIRQWLDKPGQDTEYRILYNSGFGDFIKRMHKAMNNEDPEYYKIPDTMNILDYMELFSGEDEDYDGRPDAFEMTLSPNYDKTNLMVRIGTLNGELMTTKKTEITLNYIKKYLEEKPNPNGYSYIMTGGPTNFLIVASYIVNGQIKTIFLSIFIIAIIILFLFRNPSASIVSVVPISCTIFRVFGFMGFYGIPLGMAQALISTIAIGIGIDDTIHFMNTLRKNLNEGLPLEEAIRATHMEAGLAIVYTSVAIVFGFSVLMLSHFAPIFQSGMLVTGVMISSTIADLLLLPSLILFFNLHIHKIKDWKIFRIVKLHKLLVNLETNK